jgi:hypothetical protein
MQKLTAEQSIWLLKKLSENPDIAQYTNEIDEIINQCTEKEFPRHMPNYANVQIDYAPENKDSFIKLCLFDDGFMSYAKYLNVDEFKQFTQGCIAITKWLQEQENE